MKRTFCLHKVNGEVAHQRKTLKRFMDTILSRIPDLIKKRYSKEDQILLNEFLAVLRNYDKADYDRNTIYELFEKFNRNFYRSNQYAKLPFLWFACTYFANAKIILSVARFHADSFKAYLVQQLRGNSKQEGVFNLLRKGVKLTDTLWEDLQYTSFKLGIPLSSEELQAIESIYSYIPEAGLHVLNPQRVKMMILNRVKSLKIAKNLPNIFTLLDMVWFLRFHHPAFGIEQVVFHFQLNESSPLEEIIEFDNFRNTTLCTSNVYQVIGFQRTFIGILRVPKPEVENLRNFLLKKERQGQLILHVFALVNDTRISCSLAHYQARMGWRTPTPTSLRRLALPLKTAHPRKRRMKLPPYFLSPSLNQHWNYLQESDPSHVVELYSKFSGFYSFYDLYSNLSKPDLAHLKELHKNYLFHISFYSNRLLLEFSPNFYLIKMPPMPLDQLSRLLISLPYALLFFTKNNTYVWTCLTNGWKKWMEKEFKTWVVIPIIEKYYPMVFDSKWFDSESLLWKLPLVLRK